MSLNDVILPKEYQNTRVLFEQNLDAWRLEAEQGFFVSNLNLTQLAKDCFLPGYQYDNDGVANFSQSLEQRINLLASGGTPISGTTSDTYTINADGNAAVLSTLGLTTNHTYLFPDFDGTFLLEAAPQPVSNKTFLDNLVFRSGTAFTGTLDHANTANRIWTLPDVDGTIALSTLPIFLTNVDVYNGFDFRAYSDAGVTQTAGIDGATGAITGSTLALAPMTTGSVLFSGAAGLLSQDNANFFWDDTANSLRVRLMRIMGAGAGVATVQNASTGTDRTLTIPDPGANASFVVTEGTQTINGSKTFSNQIVSTLATGTPPLSINSTTKVINLNAELLDGLDSSDFVRRTGFVNEDIFGVKTFLSAIITQQAIFNQNVGEAIYAANNCVWGYGHGASGGGYGGGGQVNIASYTRNAVGEYTVAYTAVASNAASPQATCDATTVSNVVSALITAFGTTNCSVGIINDGGIPVDSTYLVAIFGG